MKDEINEDFGKTGFIDATCLNEVKWMTECAGVSCLHGGLKHESDQILLHNNTPNT